VPEEQSRYNLQAANEALEAARAQLDETVSGADVDQLRAARANVAAAAAQRDVAQAQLDLLLEGVSEEQIEAVEAQVAQARVALKQAELSLEQATLVAPFEGVVAAVNVTIGEQASAGLPAVTMVDKSECFITVSVDEIDVAQIEKGQAAEITLDALPETTITGTVKRIAPASGLEEGIVTYDVTIGLAPTDAPIRVDMTANATILVDELDDVLQIPTWVVRVDPDSGQAYVHRRVGDKIERVDVKLGVRHQGTVQVLDGLTEGDEVVRLPESETVQLEHP
jgi:RND family efflux transporter MFP subunit